MQKTDKVKEIVDTLKNSPYPLYLFGKGTTTNRIIDFLEQNKVKIYGVLVNRDYFGNGGFIKNVPMLIFEDFLSQNECALLICTGDYFESLFPEKYKQNIKKIYAYDFWGLFAIGINNLNYWNADFLAANEEFLNSFRNELADEKSKKVFDQNYLQRTTLTYAREFDNPNDQYFDKDIVTFNKKEIFVDCGAFHGENLIEFHSRLKETDSESVKAYEFEADPLNVEVMEKNIKSIKNVIIMPCAVWNSAEGIYVDTAQTGGGAPLRYQKLAA